MDWSAEFPGLAKGTYLNSCAYGLLPRRTRAAIEEHLQKWEDAPDWDVWGAAVERARKSFARLIGAHDDEIALQANATSGVASVMSSIEAGTILTCDLDFPTSPWLARLQTARPKVHHEHVRSPGMRPMRVDEWRRHLGPDVALACIPSVASFTGYRFDVKAFAEAAHAEDAPLLVDAFQGCGTFPIDVRRDDVDFLVTGVYKWLLGPVGIAFLYVRRDRQGLLPQTSGWMAAERPYDFDPMGPLAGDARRFQYGGANVMGAVAAATSIDLMLEVGIPNVERRNRVLVDRILAQAAERKYEVLTPAAPEERASIVTFRVPELQAGLEACRREGIVVNERLGGIRVSPHFYNREQDVDRLFHVLDQAFA